MPKVHILSEINKSLLFLLLGPTILFVLCLEETLAQSPDIAETIARFRPGEIEVTAEARFWSGPTSARITMLLETNGKTASEAYQALNQLTNTVKQAVQKIDASLSLVVRGEDFSSAAKKGSPITPGTAVQATRYLAVKQVDLKKTSDIIDKVLQAGVSAITQVEHFTDSGDTAHLAAVKAASGKAREKAELLAQSLGISIGAIVSATVTEEPLGLMLRQQMQRGVDLSRFSERDSKVYVNIRFAVTK